MSVIEVKCRPILFKAEKADAIISVYDFGKGNGLEVLNWVAVTIGRVLNLLLIVTGKQNRSTFNFYYTHFN